MVLWLLSLSKRFDHKLPRAGPVRPREEESRLLKLVLRLIYPHTAAGPLSADLLLVILHAKKHAGFCSI